MTTVSSFSPVSGNKHLSSPSSKKNSTSDVEEMTEAQTQGRLDVPVTSVASVDDSRGLNSPDCDSIEVKLTATSRWSSVQEALEACLDPFFLAGQSSVKDDKIVEELTQLLDTSLTAHVPALASLAFLQPFFGGSTRSECLDAVLRAARVSNKLLLRDDLPVPSSSGWMLSVDEAEAAGLRVGPRSHAEGVNRSVLCLERRHSSVDCEEAVRAITLPQLQATVPHHRIVKLEKSAAPSAVRVVFVSPAAAERAYAVWRASAPHNDLRVSRVVGAVAPARACPVPPRPAAEGPRVSAAAAAVATVPAVGAPRPTLQCPRVVGEAPLRPTSIDSMTDAPAKPAASAMPLAAPRSAARVPMPPPAIDAALADAVTAAAAAAAPAAASDPSTTATTPSPENSTGRPKFNVNAAPFLPKHPLDAPMAAPAAANAASASAAGWWARGGGRLPRPTGCEDVSASSMDTSEALANQMLMDTSTGWMYPGLDTYTGAAWTNKFTAVDGWADGSGAAANGSGVCGSDLLASAPPSRPRKDSPVLPACPKAVGGAMPVAPCALGDSPRMRELQTVEAVKGRSDFYPPRPVTMSLPPEQVGCSTAFDGSCGARNSPLSQTSPANLSTSRRHRHDPYSPSGFVLCAESSCTSSLSHQAGPNASLASPPAANKLLFAGSLTSERMRASFFFEDPLIKASARRGERRRLQRKAEQAEGEDGEDAAARTSSSEAESSSSNIESAPAGSSDSNHTENLEAVVLNPTAFAAGAEETASAAAGAAEEEEKEEKEEGAEEGPHATQEVQEAAVESHLPVPKSYAEALRLKARTPPAPIVVSAKPVEAKKEKTGKTRVAATTAASTTRPTAVAPKKTGTAASKTTTAPTPKSLQKPKKMTVAA